MSETNGTAETAVDFSILDAMLVQEDSVVFTVTVSGVHELNWLAMKEAVTARISEPTKRYAGVYTKSLARMIHHYAHLKDSVLVFFDAYDKMTGTAEPKKRASTAFKARQSLLESMSDKMLRAFASEHIDDSEYILPDDRAELIYAVCQALAVAVDEEKTEESVETSA